MKQGSLAWVQRVLLAAKGAGRGHGSLSRECTCPGVRDVANAATVSSVEASAQSTSALHSTHAAKQSANILGPGTYGTGGAKAGPSKFPTSMAVVGSAFVVGMGAGGIMANIPNPLDKVSSDDIVSRRGKSAIQWLPESWTARFLSAPFFGAQSPDMKGFLTPNFLADAAAKAAPSVVNISIHGNGSAVQSGQFEAGSGFIISPEGMIVTNAHVLQDAMVSQLKGSPPIMVSLQDERVFEARVLSCDRVSDIAILKIEANEPLPCAKLGTSSRLKVGEWVLAMGSPLHLQNSVAAGIVSCVDRKAVHLGLAKAQIDYIQTDAAVNSGNSGGPLVNLCGEVVGISSLKAVSADGVSFAIPVDAAKDIINQLIKKGRVVRPYIGIKMLQLNSGNVVEFRKRDPTFPDVSQGILVPHVTVASPAYKAGLRPGDVITGYAGETAVTAQGLIKALGQHVGKSMELQVRRPSSEVPVVLQVTASEASN